jgi:aryl-alcohol dehydrogenase-like predicted oxidoreductase
MDTGADHGLAPARINRQFQSSLERLGVDRVELYLAHEFDPEVPLADTIGAFEALAAGGRIGAYGVSNFNAAQLGDALRAGAPQAVQNSYSLLDRGDGNGDGHGHGDSAGDRDRDGAGDRDGNGDDGGVLALCARHGLSYLAFGPLAGGWLSGKYRRGEPYPVGSRMTQRPEPYERLNSALIFDALAALERIAARRGCSMASTALAWLLADDRVSQVVTGPGRPEHLVPVREALDQPLSAAERAEIETAFAELETVVE